MTLLDYNKALEEFEKAIKIDSSYITVYFNIGLCHYYLNNKKEAIYNFNKVVDYYPNDIEALINLVKCYREIGKPKNSYDLLIKKIPIFLNNEKNYMLKIPKIYFEIAMSLLDLENYDEAIKYFKKCIDYEINKNHKKDIQLLSECYSKEEFCFSKLNIKKINKRQKIIFLFNFFY